MMPDDLKSRGLSLIVVEVSLLITLNILSLIGTTLVCISICKNNRLRTTTNLFIMVLAVSNLLSAVFVMPISASVLIAGKLDLWQNACQLYALFSLFVIYVSPVTVGLKAVNRYVRICKSDQQYRRLFSARKSRAMIASVWSFDCSVFKRTNWSLVTLSALSYTSAKPVNLFITASLLRCSF